MREVLITQKYTRNVTLPTGGKIKKPENCMGDNGILYLQ